MTSSPSSSDIQVWEVKEPYLKLHCKLGEGPYYERATNTLRFVDIMQKRLHTVDLAATADPAASLVTQQLDTPISVTADIAGVDPRDKILIGAKFGIAVLDRQRGDGSYEYVTKFHGSGKEGEEGNPRLRGNDGAVDPHGRFWLGTMTDFELGPFQPEGSVHMFAGRQDPVVVREGVTIPNSVSWSPDGRTMYFTHSSARTIHAYDYSSEDPAQPLSGERVFYKHEGPGEPDGHRVDVEGNLWTAVYGESRVLKIAGRTGRVVGEVRLPTRNITCVEFVGTELFITTAGMEAGDGSEQEVDYSGALFRVDVGVRGLEPHEFKLDL